MRRSSPTPAPVVGPGETGGAAWAACPDRIVAVVSVTEPGSEPGGAAPTRTDTGGMREPWRPRFRPDVQGLRAVAVLLVVACHAGLGVPAGFIGVDVFFVVS